ncbi:MAG: methyltransferase domain-containing protein [Magnetococcales bacterium]|nr:methyltransferase domain-containing protein [Magnetococcales bacterium]
MSLDTTPDRLKYFSVPYTRGLGLDLGCGDTRIWPGSLGIDHSISANGAALARDIADLALFRDHSLDYVFSIHGLNRFPTSRFREILLEWWRVIKPGGFLILCYRPEVHPSPTEESHPTTPSLKPLPPNPLTIMRELAASHPHGIVIEVNEPITLDQDRALFQVFRKIRDGGWHASPSLSGRKRALVIRYGGFGDILQASSIFPGLKMQGYEVWLNTTPKGQDILAHDPHVDGWWLQDDNQVPNHELGPYWQALTQRFDRVINLSESVEGTLLTIPSRINDQWPRQARQLLLNHNHMTVVHALAGVPEGSHLRFHPSATERFQARRMRRSLGQGPVIMWVLAGSSLHKAWPFVDHVVAALLLERPHARIILVGDAACRILERGWRLERRVLRRSGRWSIRRTLSMAQHVDVIVGPETGVMNAMGLEPVGKVLFLSHSSIANLSSHWKHTVNLTPPTTVSCYPCQRLHYDWDRCQRDQQTGAAWCAAAITPDRVLAAILFLLGELHETRRSH